MKTNNPSAILKAVEMAADEIDINKLCPQDYDLNSLSTKSVPFFKQYGIKVPQAISELYSKYNGIESEKYISAGLYYFYITPYLTNLNLIMAYDDKNMYNTIFSDMLQPNTILRCMEGHYYLPDNSRIVGKEMSFDEVIEFIRETSKTKSIIIKLAQGSGGGEGVQMLSPSKMTREELTNAILDFSPNFIIQDIVKNHVELSKFNKTSLNTCRLITYRRVNSSEIVLLAAMIRFGNEGETRDNASLGGGYCRIFPSGKVDDVIHTYHSFGQGSLKRDKGLESMAIPNYEEMKSKAIELHKQLPYFDLIGWDLTVDENNNIVLIEFNYAPTISGIQISNGPLFGEYTEELIAHLQKPLTTEVNALRRSFEGGRANFDYVFDLDKKVGL